jgi:hypothetical protein
MARHNLEQAQEEARRRLDRAERKTRMRARLVSAWRKFWAKPE